jgi:hypothetical protein
MLINYTSEAAIITPPGSVLVTTGRGAEILKPEFLFALK